MGDGKGHRHQGRGHTPCEACVHGLSFIAPDVKLTPLALHAMLEAHLVRVRNKYCPSAIEEAAESAAAGFQWPAEALHRDADAVRSEGSLGAIKAKIESNGASRFSGERVDTMFSTDPKYPTLRDICPPRRPH